MHLIKGGPWLDKLLFHSHQVAFISVNIKFPMKMGNDAMQQTLSQNCDMEL